MKFYNTFALSTVFREDTMTKDKIKRYDFDREISEEFGTQYLIIDNRHGRARMASTDSAYFAERIVKALNAAE